MRQPEDPGLPAGPPADPTRDLLLAQALNACITAERGLPGSAQEIIARQPAWARDDLQRLVGLALSLDAVASNAIMSSEFRVAARARLMQRIHGSASTDHGDDQPGGPSSAPTAGQRNAQPGRPATAAPAARLVQHGDGHASTGHGRRQPVQPATAGALVAARRRVVAPPPGRARRFRKTFCKVIVALVAASLAVGVVVKASASARPGEPLYGLKQAREELAVRLAPDGQKPALALLNQADARLDETGRLVEQERPIDASATAH